MYGAVPPETVKSAAPVELPKHNTFVCDVLDVGFALTETTVAALDAEQTKPSEEIIEVTLYEADAETVYVEPVPTDDCPLNQ